MALDTLANITQDEVEYARMSTLLKSELDWQSREVGARRKGLAEGFTKGHDEASLDIARNLKGMGLPISQIAEGTGLPIETIERM